MPDLSAHAVIANPADAVADVLAGGGAAPPPRTVAGGLAEVVFPVPVDRGFDYRVPPDLRDALRPGHRVMAPFGKRGAQMGVVLRRHDDASASPGAALKTLERLVDPFPALAEADLGLARWIAERYFCTIGQAVFAALQVGRQTAPKRTPVVPLPAAGGAAAERTAAPLHTEEQAAAAARILPAVRERRHETFLLWGVAAAGKTEVYLAAIAEALANGRSALYLVPEIGLTPQVEAILRARFGPVVEVWHSEVARGDRWRTWMSAREGRCRVLLGPRSAVFAPLRDLGLIVVDEEHDPSYKEDANPRYHAREVALERARRHGVPAVLGSATPSLESWHRARAGRFTLIEMPRRVHDRPAPRIELVDVRHRSGAMLSEPLARAVTECLERGEQVLLFHNRRGFNTHVLCGDCGWEARCPRCGVTLVHHKPAPRAADLLSAAAVGEELRCHYCAHSAPPPPACPDCRKPTVTMRGRGTQKIVSDLALWFPKARVLRWDRDATRRKGAHGRAHDAVRSDAVDIVVGTQMIAQGLDFPGMTLVGVLDADRSLRFPDFRAGERTFQLLTQVSGRAGRAEKPGAVYLQTRHPDHYAIQAAGRLDYRAFAEEELRFREEMRYPPFVRLAQILLRGKDPAKVEAAAEGLLRWLEDLPPPDGVECLGPSPAFHALRADLTQWQVMLKGSDAGLTAVLARLREHKPPKTVTLAVDVEPEELQ